MLDSVYNATDRLKKAKEDVFLSLDRLREEAKKAVEDEAKAKLAKIYGKPPLKLLNQVLTVFLNVQ